MRFPGQYHDQETGFSYNYHRYYDPVTARYISPDPLGFAPAPNPHAYVPNPTLEADPLGLAPCTIRVSPVSQDWGTKGAHLHVGGQEVRVFPRADGEIGVEGIRLKTGLPTSDQLDQVLAALKSDPTLRADLIQKARAAMDAMNRGAYGMSQNRAAEMHFLIKALEKIK